MESQREELLDILVVQDVAGLHGIRLKDETSEAHLKLKGYAVGDKSELDDDTVFCSGLGVLCSRF